MDPKQAVDLRIEEGAIARLTLQETESKNTFSHAFCTGIALRLAEIGANPALKVVVVHGFDSIFAAGGTQDELIGIMDKKIQFTDLDVMFKGFLECPIPVISAMQGHAVGGGFIMGLMADFVILAEERLYSANFMKYGFTPGMGATMILRERFGSFLANEMMFTARSYHGGELKSRGASCRIVTKDEVIPEALKLAHQIIDKPRESLVQLKRTIADRILAQLAVVVDDELRMHDVTFAQEEVRSRILSLFGK